MGRILYGTCAWADHEDFYPGKVKPNERLKYYARFFKLVEVDSSFYAIPNPAYVERWAQQTPEDFTFNMKAFKGMTGHERGYSVEERKVFFPAFRHAIEPMRASGKLAAVLFQFAPWFLLTRENVDYIRAVREHFHDLTLAVEFRHRSWFDEEMRERTLSFLKKEQLVNTIVDEPQVGDACIPTVDEVTENSLAIVRFHGRNKDTWYIKDAKHSWERFRYHYQPEELMEWVPRVHRLAQKAARVHLLMNNNFSNYAIRNAFDLMDMLGEPVERPPLPGEQMGLF